MAQKRAQMNVRLDPTVIADADLDRSMIGPKGISRDAYVAEALTFYRQHRTAEVVTTGELTEAAALAARIRGDAPTPASR